MNHNFLFVKHNVQTKIRDVIRDNSIKTVVYNVHVNVFYMFWNINKELNDINDIRHFIRESLDI